MGQLFQRSASIIVGDIKINTGIDFGGKRTLRVQFVVKKSLTKNANSCEIKIYNLNQDSRGKLDELSEDVPASVSAGYAKGLNEIFVGDRGIVSSYNNSMNAEWITYVTLGDAATKIRKKRSKVTEIGRTEITSVIQKMIDDIDLAPGNVVEKIKEKLTGENAFFNNGYSFSGKSMDGISEIAAKAGLQVSVQNGVLQALGTSDTNFGQSEAQVFTPESGLVGSPETGDEGYISIKVLLNGEIKPGDLYFLQSATATKFQKKSPFKAVSVSHTGDTYGLNWYTEIEGLPLEQ